MRRRRGVGEHGWGRVEEGDCRKILLATVLLCIIYYFVSTGGGGGGGGSSGQATLPSVSRTACSSADRAGGPNADLARRSFISGSLHKRRRRCLDGVHGRHCVIAIILRGRGRRGENDAKRRRQRRLLQISEGNAKCNKPGFDIYLAHDVKLSACNMIILSCPSSRVLM